MVGEPADIVVERLTWTAEAVVHVRRHGVTPADIDEVFANAPRYFEDLPGRSGTHIMLGPNASGRFLYVVIAPGVFEGEWVIVQPTRTVVGARYDTTRGQNEEAAHIRRHCS